MKKVICIIENTFCSQINIDESTYKVLRLGDNIDLIDNLVIDLVIINSSFSYKDATTIEPFIFDVKRKIEHRKIPLVIIAEEKLAQTLHKHNITTLDPLFTSIDLDVYLKKSFEVTDSFLCCPCNYENPDFTQMYQNISSKHNLITLGEMSAVLLHQWKQPLFSLFLSVEQIKKLSKNSKFDQINSVINDMYSSLHMLNDTTQNIQMYYNNVERPMQTYEMHEAIQDVLTFMNPIFEKNSIEVRFNHKKHSYMYGYAGDIKQILVNLFSNSKIFFSLRGVENGIIDISLKSTNMYYFLKIHDNGGGIKEEHLSKVFDLNFTNTPKGSGLGLFLSKKICEQNLKGLIRCSNKRQGASFLLAIPKNNQQTARNQQLKTGEIVA